MHQNHKQRVLFENALFFSDLNIKAWNVNYHNHLLDSRFSQNTFGNVKAGAFPKILCPRIQRRFRTSSTGIVER